MEKDIVDQIVDEVCKHGDQTVMDLIADASISDLLDVLLTLVHEQDNIQFVRNFLDRLADCGVDLEMMINLRNQYLSI